MTTPTQCEPTNAASTLLASPDSSRPGQGGVLTRKIKCGRWHQGSETRFGRLERGGITQHPILCEQEVTQNEVLFLRGSMHCLKVPSLCSIYGEYMSVVIQSILPSPHQRLRTRTQGVPSMSARRDIPQGPGITGNIPAR